MTFRPMKPETIARRAVDAAAEQLRRRTEAVERLRPLAAQDPEMWQELLDDAEDRLRDTLAAAAPGQAEPPAMPWCEPCQSYHHDTAEHIRHDPEPHARFGPSDPLRWLACPACPGHGK